MSRSCLHDAVTVPCHECELQDEEQRRRAELFPDLVAALKTLHNEIDATTNIGWCDDMNAAMKSAKDVLTRAEAVR